MNPPFELISAYLDDELTAARVEQLRAWLKADPEHIKQFIRETYIHQRMRETLHGDTKQHLMKEDSGLQDLAQGMGANDHSQRASILAEVMDQERAAREKREAAQAAQEALRQAELLERREIRRMLTGEAHATPGIKNYVIPRPLFYGGIAAAIALVAMLFLPGDPSVTPPGQDDGSSPHFVDVAVLVEEIDAKWVGGTHPMEPGKPVYNEAVSLVEGMARLRFNDEAEVVVRAPATFEPLAGDRMRLTRGRIVGKCPTLKSRGFTVIAPNAQIVDRGTEFGVTVSEDGSSDVHVFDGRVRASILGADGSVVDSQRLDANEAVHLDHGLRSIAQIASDTSQYAWGLPWAAYFDRNLVVNGDFEQGPYSEMLFEQGTISSVEITGWQDDNKATAVTYELSNRTGNWFNLDRDPLPENRGKGFFVGRENGIVWQEIDLAGAAERIDRQSARFFLSAWLGGYIDQNDRTAVRVVFLNASGRDIGSEQIGPMTHIERNNTTGFFARHATGIMPRNTRSVRIELETFEDENVADGYVDNVSFRLMGTTTQ